MVRITYNICKQCLRIQSPTIKRKSNGKFIKLNNGILYADDTFICYKCMPIENDIKITVISTSVNTITNKLPIELVTMIFDLVS